MSKISSRYFGVTFISSYLFKLKVHIYFTMSSSSILVELTMSSANDFLISSKPWLVNKTTRNYHSLNAVTLTVVVLNKLPEILDTLPKSILYFELDRLVSIIYLQTFIRELEIGKVLDRLTASVLFYYSRHFYCYATQ